MEAQLPPNTTDSSNVNTRYGEWEEGSFMEEDFWDKYLEKRRKESEEEEKERKERIEKARKEEKSWELARVLKQMTEESKSNSWYKDKS